GAMAAADGFFGALQAKDWKRMYSYLPTEPQTNIVGGRRITSQTSLTEAGFIQKMQSKGLSILGTDFTVKYRILGVDNTAPDSAKVRVEYLVGSEKQVRFAKLDPGSPNGLRNAGTQP